jgi:hypothetical protein
MAQVATLIVATLGGTTVDPVAPRRMRPGTKRYQEVEQHNECETAAVHHFTPLPIVLHDGPLSGFVPLREYECKSPQSLREYTHYSYHQPVA